MQYSRRPRYIMVASANDVDGGECWPARIGCAHGSTEGLPDGSVDLSVCSSRREYREIDRLWRI
jgi:hypothetical protein